MGRVDGWPQTPTPDPHPFLLGSHHGGRNWSLESPCFGVRTSGRSPKPKLQGLKFPLVFAQKHLAQAAPPPTLSPPCLPACLSKLPRWNILVRAGLCGGEGSQQETGSGGAQDSALATVLMWH